MSTPRAPWATSILDQLADGEWHDRDEVLTVAARTVPPGVAYRLGEAERRRTNEGSRTRGDDTTSIAAGARRKAREGLFKLLRAGHVERDGERIRLARR